MSTQRRVDGEGLELMNCFCWGKAGHLKAGLALVLLAGSPAFAAGTNAMPSTNGPTAEASASSAPTVGKESEPPPAPTRLDPAVYRVRPGFTVELVAAEPLVFAPSAMAFDEDGRLYVTEMRDWPGRRDATPHLGRVRMLEDTDGDGVFDAGTVLADNLPMPSAIACFNRGLYVGVTPEIIYLKPPHGGGTGTVQTVVFAGFGGTNVVDPERLLGGFTWGPDMRIHGVASGMGGMPRSPTVSGSEAAELGIHDFSFDPRTLAFTAETGPGQSGLAFDSRGGKLVSGRERPLRQVMTSVAFYGRNPAYAPAPGLMDVLSPATPAYPASSATRARAGGLKAGLQAGGAAPPVWLTSVRALLVYHGGAFPPAYHEDVFVADDEARLIHRAVLRETGLLLSADRAAGEGDAEFFRSTDPDFHPRCLTTGPDGAIYVADLRSNGAQGRIYRIAPSGAKAGRKIALGGGTTHELALLLGHTNSWRRETAARLIWERRDPAAPGLLTNIVHQGRLPQARVEAVNLLAAIGHVKEGWVLRALADVDERVRQRAVIAIARLADGSVPDSVWAQLEILASDPSIHVRRDLAWALGEVTRPQRLALLAEIVRRDPDNPWIRDAVMSSLGQGAGTFLAGLAHNAGFRRSEEGQAFLREVARMIGAGAQTESVPAVIDYLLNGGVPARENLGLLAALGDGLRNANISMSRVDPTRRLQPYYVLAFDAVGDGSLPMSMRIDAARVVGLGTLTYEEAATLLLLLPGSTGLLPLQTAVVSALGHYQSPAFVNNLAARWTALPAGLRVPALSAMLLSAGRIPSVLDALNSGPLSGMSLLQEQANMLRFYPNRDVSARALDMFGDSNTYRAEAMDRYRPSLSLRGAPERGRRIFQDRCAACHQIGGEGQRVGPDLTGVVTQGKEAVASAILEPNSRIRPGYETWFVQTRGLENHVGVVERPFPSALVLRRRDGVPLTFPVDALEYFEPQPWSLMPDGLEEGLSGQDFADLLDFLMVHPQGGPRPSAAVLGAVRAAATPARATP